MSKKIQRMYNVTSNVVQRKNILVQRNNAFEIDEVGLSIWKHCDGGHSVEEIAEALTKEYQVEYDEALIDCQEYIEQMTTLGLLQ